MNKYIIGICGIGFVGNSMMKSFLNKGFELNKNLFCYDKFKNGGIGNFDSLINTDILFLALPTKFITTNMTYDLDPIHETLTRLFDSDYKGIIVIKSTLVPTTTHKLSLDYKLSLIHNPEFLTARSAYSDFHNQKHIVLGKSCNITEEQLIFVKTFYNEYYPDAIVSFCSSDESESMKIFVNSFYSVKIQFFNELYLLCENTGCNYDIIKDLMIKNGWINSMHTEVPGPDGQLSYGGLCFPKDTNALLKFMEKSQTKCKVLKSVVEERCEMRDDNDNIV
jgi:UDPglucose 6-dehydrogenase